MVYRIFDFKDHIHLMKIGIKSTFLLLNPPSRKYLENEKYGSEFNEIYNEELRIFGKDSRWWRGVASFQAYRASHRTNKQKEKRKKYIERYGKPILQENNVEKIEKILKKANKNLSLFYVIYTPAVFIPLSMIICNAFNPEKVSANLVYKTFFGALPFLIYSAHLKLKSEVEMDSARERLKELKLNSLEDKILNSDSKKI